MTGHTSSLKIPFPNGGDAPDGPGGIQALAEFLETDTFAQGPWSAGYGGGSGAFIGDNGGSNGFVWKDGRAVKYRGRIAFGSSAVVGGGVLTGFTTGVNDQSLLGGTGIFVPPTGAPVAIMLLATSTSELTILLTSNGAAFSSLGNPPQSSVIVFEATGIIPPHA